MARIGGKDDDGSFNGDIELQTCYVYSRRGLDSNLSRSIVQSLEPCKFRKEHVKIVERLFQIMQFERASIKLQDGSDAIFSFHVEALIAKVREVVTFDGQNLVKFIQDGMLCRIIAQGKAPESSGNLKSGRENQNCNIGSRQRQRGEMSVFVDQSNCEGRVTMCSGSSIDGCDEP